MIEQKETRVLAIIGSRTCIPVYIGAYLTFIPDTIVSGGAKGVDTYAREYAKKKGLKLIEFFPNYERYGRCAPLERNKLIVDTCDEILAFWDGKSKGTKYTIDYAKEKGKLIFLFNFFRQTSAKSGFVTSK